MTVGRKFVGMVVVVVVVLEEGVWRLCVTDSSRWQLKNCVYEG